MKIYKCPKCGEVNKLHFNYDYTQQHRPIKDVLCNMCGEVFDGNIPVAELTKYSEIEETLAICNDIIDKGEMNRGKLFKTGWDNWLLKVNGVSYPIHEQHSFWLKMWAEEGKEINYVIENGVAILKAYGPDTHEYTQE